VIIPVALAPGQAGAVSADEIVSWCRDNLAHFKCPKSVEFVDSLPRTTTGKVLKRELREQLSQARS
jgi:fatty-acyl-CoA synthase